MVDGWLAGVGDEVFTDVLPLLRRTFATFGPAERRQIGERVRRLGDRLGRRRPPATTTSTSPGASWCCRWSAACWGSGR